MTLEEYLKLYKKEEYKERKIAQYLMENYVNQSDTFKFLYYSSGKNPKCITMTVTQNSKRQFPLGEGDIRKHLKGHCGIGIYPRYKTQTKLIAFDIDINQKANEKYKSIDNCKEVLELTVAKLFQFGITDEYVLCSFSGGKGYHVDIILDDYIDKDVAEKFQKIVNVEVFSEASFEANKGVNTELRGSNNSGYKLPLCYHYLTANKAYLCNEYGVEIDDLECLNKKTLDASIIQDIVDINYEDILLYTELDEVVKNVNMLDIHMAENTSRRERVVEILENGLTSEYVSKYTRDNSRHQVLYEVVLYLKLIEKLDEAQALAIVTNWVKNQWERDLVDKEILEDIKTTVSSTYNTKKAQYFDVATKDFNITKKHMREVISIDVKHKQKTLALRKLYFILMIHSNYFADSKTNEFYMSYKTMMDMGAVKSDRSLLKRQLDELEALGKITIVKRGIRKTKADAPDCNKENKKMNIKDLYESNVYKLNVTFEALNVAEKDKVIKHCKMAYNCDDCMQRCSCELLSRRETSKFISLSDYKKYSQEGCPYNKNKTNLIG